MVLYVLENQSAGLLNEKLQKMNKVSAKKGLRLTLGRKLLIVVLTFTGLFSVNFIAYNYLLRELNRTATAVDAAGLQRMLSQKMAYMASLIADGRNTHREELAVLIAQFEETLLAFKQGGYSRGFFVAPAPASVVPFVQKEENEWRPYRDAVLVVHKARLGSPDFKRSLDYIEVHADTILAACNDLTDALRKTAEDAAGKMARLMLLLIFLSLLFGAFVISTAFKRIAVPLLVLDNAAEEIIAGNFPELKAKTFDDEVGNLFKTFSRMSSTIKRDTEKSSVTADLLAISTEPISIQEQMAKFLKRLLSIPWLSAEPRGAIFLADSPGKGLKIAAQSGLTDEEVKLCVTTPFGQGLCGKEAAGREEAGALPEDSCQVFCGGVKTRGHYCLPIKISDKLAGVLNIYTGTEKEKSDLDFLEASCAIIANAIEYKGLEAEAYQARKMDSLGKSAGALAHDFNNILTVIQGFNELAKETLPGDNEAQRFLKETSSGINKGIALVKQLLSFSRKQPAVMSRVDLNSVLDSARPMLQMVLEKKVKVKLCLAPGLPAISANKGQLEQVLMNLAVNSRDAMLPDGGEFSITTTEASAETARSCAQELALADRVVRLSVSDTGSGMSQEVLEHVFEPFYTTKLEGLGTGLGLATVYSIIKLHRGGINITSCPGEGTTFDICFPADSDQS
ncbi:MAG: hypothetical protein AUJ51_02240 [Elusimicrobia bacterium CG1_02_56_21]|nr:MAG: hypothetical protein AUJ51_02240 [Elusimicrobia bacterium CG1_02_56_21]